MKTKHYQRLGIGLFASLLLLAAPHALAEENITSDQIETDSNSTATSPTTEAYTDNSQLNQAISQAKAEGIMTVKTEEESFETAQNLRRTILNKLRPSLKRPKLSRSET